MSEPVRVSVYSEDGNAEGLSILVGRLLQRYDEGSRQELVTVRVSPPHPVLRGNQWKDGKRHAERLTLAREIAGRIRQGEVVVFHYDGDSSWSLRGSGPVTASQFDKELRVRVAQLLNAPARPIAGARPLYEGATPLSRLIECVPYYSIEAWFYQATDRACELCKLHHGGKDVERFTEWSRNRAAVDEVPRLKQETCLTASYNDKLAPHVPVREVLAIGKSLAAFRDALAACAELAPLLRVY